MRITQTKYYDVNEQSIKDTIGVQTLTDAQLTSIAEVLVANLEGADQDDEVVMSDPDSFNDAYADMVHDLRTEYNPDYVDPEE